MTKKIFCDAITIIICIASLIAPAYAEFKAPAGEEVKGNNRFSVVYHDPAVVAGRKEPDPEALTYSKVTIRVGTDTDIKVLSHLDTEISNELLDPADLAEANGIESFEGEHSFYLKDGQIVTLLVPNGTNYEVAAEDLNWFLCGYQVQEETSWYVANKWVFPSGNTFSSVVDIEHVTVGIFPCQVAGNINDNPE